MALQSAFGVAWHGWKALYTQVALEINTRLNS
jgi:hypothetical protein